LVVSQNSKKKQIDKNMKKKDFHLLYATVALFIFTTSNMYAFNYNVSFSGSGLSSTVDSVLVTNSYKGTSITIHSGETLVLTSEITTVNDVASINDELCVFTNSENSVSTLSFYAKKTGFSTVSVFSGNGRKVIETGLTLQEGRNAFEMNLSGGVFIIQVSGNGYSYTKKFLSQSSKMQTPRILYIGFSADRTTSLKKNKSGLIRKMYCSENDNIIFKGMSQNYATITSARPNSDTNINFNFMECKDASGNNYAVVEIGNQIWMGENLKTTKFQNGDNIPTTTPAIKNITSETSPIYQWAFDGNENNSNLYGRLYTWYATTDSRNLAPFGWHVPSDTEFTTLEMYLFNNGYNYDPSYNGDMVGKSLASNILWNTDSKGGNIGCDLTLNNFSDYNALPVGKRKSDGTFDYLNYSTLLWSLTGYSTTDAWGRQLCSNYPDFYNAYIPKQFGCSIRCLKNSQSSNTKSQIKTEQYKIDNYQFINNEGQLREK
jgi:uncharacterized protein (TIGR02145 family)